MKKIVASLVVLATTSLSLLAMQDVYNAAESIPCVIPDGWKKIPDVAQYKQADWSTVIGKAEDVTVEQAKRIANSNPEITYFFYVKGYRLVLEDTTHAEVIYRIFHHGDAIFFAGEPCWGTAPDLADGYIKE